MALVLAWHGLQLATKVALWALSILRTLLTLLWGLVLDAFAMRSGSSSSGLQHSSAAIEGLWELLSSSTGMLVLTLLGLAFGWFRFGRMEYR